ncbi:MAG TPA: ATP-binding protein [Acidimicrobiales bacterium]|nr:ATP-binding protein [Acidimicrobiales bacterium]
MAVGAISTAALTLAPGLRLATENESLHVAMATGEGMVAMLLAYMAYGRTTATRRRSDLLVAVSFAAFAVAGLTRAVLAGTTQGGSAAAVVAWSSMLFALLGTASFCAAALTSETVRLRASARRATWAIAGVLLVAMVAVLAVGARALFPEVARPGTGVDGWNDGTGAVLAIQLAIVALAVTAAWGFLRRYRTEGDEILVWLGLGSILRACARLSAFLYPSLTSSEVYTGDLLRVSAYVVFLVGAAREIAGYWRQRALVGVLEERGRIAQEFHDGLSQELSFLKSQLASGQIPDAAMMPHLSAAADRAALESRRALSDLVAKQAPDLATAMRHEARKVAVPLGARIDVRIDDDVDVDPEAWPNLARIVREAAANAIRHGHASRVVVRGQRCPEGVHIAIRDDGAGFDIGIASPGLGLGNMRDRAESLGGELTVRSTRTGTVVDVRIPSR